MARNSIYPSVMRILFTAAVLTVFLTGASAETFGSEEGPLPVITQIDIYDVSGLEAEERSTDGELVAEGLNETFEIEQQDETRTYRFDFTVVNEGEEDWVIEDEDELSHKGIDESWSTERVWYNLTDEEDFEGGEFEEGVVEWDTSGGVLGTDEEMSAQYIIDTDQDQSRLYEQEFLVNVTSDQFPSDDDFAGSQDKHELDLVKLGFLELDIDQPVDETTLPADKTFNLNGTVSCIEGECGEVESLPRYNQSESPDTQIQEETGEPFHTEGSNSFECELGFEEECGVEWSVNATGETESYHLLDIKSSSEFEEIEDESSEDREVQINLVIMMDLEWDVVDFGLLDPGEEDRSAEGNNEMKYNITVGDDANAIDHLWVKSTDLESTEDEGYSIEAGNISRSFDNDVNNLSDANRLTNTYQSIRSDISPGTVLTNYFWIDVPQGIIRGDYSGTMSFKANSTR